jgi:hypothetical protein
LLPPNVARSLFWINRGQSSCVSVRPSRFEGLRLQGRERHGTTPEGACSPQQGATGRLVAPVRPSRPKGFGPEGVTGQVPSRRELALPSEVPPVGCRAGAIFMARRLRPEGRERLGARQTEACFCPLGVTCRPVALVRLSWLGGFGPQASSGLASGKRELASASQLPPTTARGWPSWSRGFGPATSSGLVPSRWRLASACSGASGRVPCSVRRETLRSRASPSLRSALVAGSFERPGARADESLLFEAAVPSVVCAVRRRWLWFAGLALAGTRSLWADS